MLFHFYISINQSIILYLCLWLLRRWRSINPYITEGSHVGDVYFCCMSNWTPRCKIFFCLWILISVLLTYLLPPCAITQLSSQLKTTLLHISWCAVNVNCGSSVNSNLREYCIVLFYKWNASLPVYYLHLTWRSSSPFYWHAEGGAKYSGGVTAQARIPFDEDS